MTARTPTRTFRVWSRNPASVGSSAPGVAEPGLEARVVDRRHELLREERTHRLANEVGGRDARDSQAVRDLRRHAGTSRCRCRRRRGRRSAGGRPWRASRCARSLLTASTPSVLAQHVLGKLLQALEVYGGLARAPRDPPRREGPRAHARTRGQPRADEREGEEALRIREVTLAAQRQVVESPRLCHAATVVRHGCVRERDQLGVEVGLAGKRHDVVPCQHDASAPLQGGLGDDVDCGCP